MFYRYEVRYTDRTNEWAGFCQKLSPTGRRKVSRFLSEPKWYRDFYRQNPLSTKTKCWFTQLGFDKYHEAMEEIAKDTTAWYGPIEVRVLKEKHLSNVKMKGKIQCICLFS